MAYKTKQKEAIEEYFYANRRKHSNANEIYGYLSAKGINIGLSTVYRQLENMCENGVLHKYFIDEQTVACYQLKEECLDCRDYHYHLKCKNCGKLVHMECEAMKEVAEHIRTEHGFTLDHDKTVLYGVCNDCKNKK